MGSANFLGVGVDMFWTTRSALFLPHDFHTSESYPKGLTEVFIKQFALLIC